VTTKQTPADFVVEEVLAADLARRVHARPAAFVLYRLVKENLTTPDAAAAVARALGVRPGEVACAGLKDRHARTLQHITVPRGPAETPRPDAPESLAGDGWRIERLGWVDHPITSEAIAANRFAIVVRDLTRDACRRMDEGAAALTAPSPPRPSTPAPLIFVNYFGDQRFGSARHGGGFLAKHLIRGDFADALWLALAMWHRKDTRRQKEFKRAAAEKWGRWAELAAELPRCPDRRAIEHLAANPDDYRGAFAALPYGFQELAVHAYQSHLWNAIARRLLREQCTGPILSAQDPFGEMLFPLPGSISPDLADLDLPVIGLDTRLAEPWRAAADAVLAEEEVTREMLRIPGLRRPQFGEASRRLFAMAGGFTMSEPEPQGAAADGGAAMEARDSSTVRPAARKATARGPTRFARTVSFELPRGAYATVVLRALGQ
jgi:tRNA pseudouridine13 synthase